MANGRPRRRQGTSVYLPGILEGRYAVSLTFSRPTVVVVLVPVLPALIVVLQVPALRLPWEGGIEVPSGQ